MLEMKTKSALLAAGLFATVLQGCNSLPSIPSIGECMCR